MSVGISTSEEGSSGGAGGLLDLNLQLYTVTECG